MPFVYDLSTKNQAENYTTSGTPNTEIDYQFVKPGASRPFGLAALTVQGKGAGLTALSGIMVRGKHWTSTASSGGTAATPAPKDNRAPAAVATAGLGTSGGTAAVTSGTGGPNIVFAAGCGASGPGGHVPVNPDAVPTLDGNANKSLDLFSACPTASLSFESDTSLVEN